MFSMGSLPDGHVKQVHGVCVVPGEAVPKTTGVSVSPLTARTLTELHSTKATDTKHQLEWVCNHKWQIVLAPPLPPVVFTLQHFSSQSVSPISASQLAAVRGGFIYLLNGKLKWKCSETFWFPDEKKKRIKVLKNYYLEKEANSAGIKAFFFFIVQLFVQGWSRHGQTFSQERYAHAYCFTPQSITAAWGKCQRRFLWTGGGFICARRCQTTSEHSLTFGELNKDFYLHAKFTLGRKTVHFIFPGNRLQTRRTHEEENRRP